MSKAKGNFLRLMARSETIKQADQARKLRAAQSDADRIKSQASSVARLLEEHRQATPSATNAAQLANTLRVGQQLEGHRNLLTMQKSQSERKLRTAKSALAQTGHKLDILNEKARIADSDSEND